MIPAKADPEVQTAYLQQVLEPRLAEAQAGQRAMFFMDAAHIRYRPTHMARGAVTTTQAERFARSFQSHVARNPGAACLTRPILRELGLVEAVNQQCPSDHVASHGQITQLLVVNRLQAPRPLYKVGEWLDQTALSTVLGLQPEQAHDTRLGETLDALFSHHQAIWPALILKAVQRYRLPLQGLHDDITSTYFEGLYNESQWIQFGYSRDHRPDSKQWELGVTVTGDGLPLAFRVWVGNTADRTTPRQNMEAVHEL